MQSISSILASIVVLVTTATASAAGGFEQTTFEARVANVRL